MHLFFKNHTSRQLYLWITFVFVVQINLAQQPQLFEIINKSLDLYEYTPQYEMDINYAMYNNSGSSELKKIEEHKVIIAKSDAVTKLTVFNNDMYTYDCCMVTVFEHNKEILIRDNEGLPLFASSLDYLKSYKDKYDAFMDFEDSKLVTIKLLPKKDITKNTNEIIYEQIKLTISKVDNQLVKQQLFYNQGVDPKSIASKKLKILVAMLEISFAEIKVSEICLPDITDIFAQKTSGALLPTQEYLGYTINDKRKNKTKI